MRRIALIAPNKTGKTEIIRNTYGAPIQENVIRRKEIIYNNKDEELKGKYILVELSDTDPGFNNGTYRANRIEDFKYYTMYLGRTFVLDSAWLKLRVWETGMKESYLLYYPSHCEYSIKMSGFRPVIPERNEVMSATAFEFMKIKSQQDEIHRLKRRTERRAERRAQWNKKTT
jgi:hypothetical protein